MSRNTKEPSCLCCKAETGIKIMTAFQMLGLVVAIAFGDWAGATACFIGAGFGTYGLMKRSNAALFGFEFMLIAVPIIQFLWTMISIDQVVDQRILFVQPLFLLLVNCYYTYVVESWRGYIKRMVKRS